MGEAIARAHAATGGDSSSGGTVAAADRLSYLSVPPAAFPVAGALEETMTGRFFRVALVIVLVLVVAQVMQPYVFRLMFAATTPRPVEARGELADIERSTIALFDKVSPSVVQVVGRQSGRALSTEEAEGGVQSGTGFYGTRPATSSPTIK
jgi:hypothetical protein